MTNGCLITRSTILYLLLISAQLCYRSNGKSLHNSKPVFCPKFRLTWPVYNTRFLHDPCLTSSSIRHLGRTITVKGYYNRRLNYYPNSSSSYQAIRIRVSGDVSLNPGPDKCITCNRTVATNHRAVSCDSCNGWTHIKCGNIKPNQYKAMQLMDNFEWFFQPCLDARLSNNVPDNTGDCVQHKDDYLERFAASLNTSHNDLRIAHLNVCSLRNKIEDIRLLQKICRFDVLAIGESHLNASIPDNVLQIPGLKFIRCDRSQRKGGGVIMYYAEHLSVTHRRDLAASDIEALWIRVKFPTNTTLFSVIYRSELESTNFFESFRGALEKAWLKTDSIFILGDFNCCLLNRDPDGIPTLGKTKKLIETFEDFNMQNIISQPTRITSTTESLIDLIVTTKANMVRQCGVLPLGISDHSLVYATLKLKSKRPPPKIVRSRNFKRCDIQDFQKDIERIPFHVLDIFEDKDDVLWGWNLLFNDVCDVHAPYKDVKVRSVCSPWINSEIRLKMNKRFKLFKVATRTKDPVKWKEYKRLRNEITTDVRRAKTKHFKNQLLEIKTAAEYWNLLRNATAPKLRKAIGPLKREDGSLAVDSKEKSNLMNSFFSNIGINLTRNFSFTKVNAATTLKSVPVIKDVILSKSEIEKYLSDLKWNKATGPDQISSRTLKTAGNALVHPLYHIYCESLRSGYVFEQWKVARLSPIHKKDDESDMSNYRPISILSIPSKILESTVSQRIVNHTFHEHSLVTENQWAYRKGFSTELMLIKLTEQWRQAVDNSKVVGVVFVDFQKAFDCVSHKILLHKLEIDFGIKGNLAAWLHSYLKGRRQFTVIDGAASDFARINTGVPQGSVLGPTLFALYTNDLPDNITNATVFMYADDTTLFCIGDTVDIVIAELNAALKELELWCLRNQLLPHPKKCEGMLIHRGNFNGPLQSLILMNHCIRWVKHTRLLGVYIDNRLNWDYHVKALKISFANKLNMLKRSLFLPRPMLLDLYFKVIYPSIIYGITVWGGLTNKEGLIALESLHCRAAKLIFNWPWDMPKSDVLSKARWSSIETTYKVNLAKLMFKIDKKTLPISILDTTEEVDVNTKKNLRSNANIKVPKFNTYYMKNSFSRRGPIVFNTLLQESNLRNITIKQLSSLAYKSKALLNLNFNSISPQTVNFKDPNFKYF